MMPSKVLLGRTPSLRQYGKHAHSYHGNEVGRKPLTESLVDQESVGTTDVNVLPDLERVQVLRHHAAFGKTRVGVAEVHLRERRWFEGRPHYGCHRLRGWTIIGVGIRRRWLSVK